MNSLWRVLLPPNNRPVQSSRLMKTRTPPTVSAKRGTSSSGVGRWARSTRGRREAQRRSSSVVRVGQFMGASWDADVFTGQSVCYRPRPGGQSEFPIPRADAPGRSPVTSLSACRCLVSEDFCTTEQRRESGTTVTISAVRPGGTSSGVYRAMTGNCRERLPLVPLVHAYVDAGVPGPAELGRLPGLGPRFRAVLSATATFLDDPLLDGAADDAFGAALLRFYEACVGPPLHADRLRRRAGVVRHALAHLL